MVAFPTESSPQRNRLFDDLTTTNSLQQFQVDGLTVHFARRLPRPELRPYVDHYWRLHITGDEPVTKFRFHRLPDGKPHIILSNTPDSDKLCVTFDGIMTAYTQAMNTRSHHVGICLNPSVAVSLCGRPLSDANGHLIDFDANSPYNAHFSEWQLPIRPETSTIWQRLDMVSTSLIEALPVQQCDERVERALRFISTANEPVAIDELAYSSGMSRSTIIRQFNRWLGYGPKVYCRLERFRAAFDHVATRRSVNLAGIAKELGYFDQSHLIREFRHFSGFTPKQLQRICHTTHHSDGCLRPLQTPLRWHIINDTLLISAVDDFHKKH